MRYCFLVELRGATAEVVIAAVTNVAGCNVQASRSPAREMETVIVLFVDTELDEDAAFQAIFSVLPVGATLHRLFDATPTAVNKPKM